MSLLEDFQSTVKTLSKETPDQMAGFSAMMKAVKGQGVLPEKTKCLALVCLDRWFWLGGLGGREAPERAN